MDAHDLTARDIAAGKLAVLFDAATTAENEALATEVIRALGATGSVIAARKLEQIADRALAAEEAGTLRDAIHALGDVGKNAHTNH